jgi:hypothetical protein
MSIKKCLKLQEMANQEIQENVVVAKNEQRLVNEEIDYCKKLINELSNSLFDEQFDGITKEDRRLTIDIMDNYNELINKSFEEDYETTLKEIQQLNLDDKDRETIISEIIGEQFTEKMPINDEFVDDLTMDAGDYFTDEIDGNLSNILSYKLFDELSVWSDYKSVDKSFCEDISSNELVGIFYDDTPEEFEENEFFSEYTDDFTTNKPEVYVLTKNFLTKDDAIIHEEDFEEKTKKDLIYYIINFESE